MSLALSYIGRIDEKQAHIEKAFSDLVVTDPYFQQRSQAISAYRTNMETLLNLYKSGTVSSRQSLQIQNTVTQLGRELTTDIEEVVKTEKKKVFELLDRSREYLMVSLLLLFILTLVAAIFLVIKLNRPLKAIETGIKHIATGI